MGTNRWRAPRHPVTHVEMLVASIFAIFSLTCVVVECVMIGLAEPLPIATFVALAFHVPASALSYIAAVPKNLRGRHTLHASMLVGGCMLNVLGTLVLLASIMMIFESAQV